MLDSMNASLIFLGEHGIGKTELMKELVRQAQTDSSRKMVCAYVEAWPSLLATDPFVDALAKAIDSVRTLQSTAEKAKKRLDKLAGALESEGKEMLVALATELAQKALGKETVEFAQRIASRYRGTKSDLEQAHQKLATQPQSLIYSVNDFLHALHRNNPDVKLLLAFDQLERLSESSWWLLLDLIRGSSGGTYVLAAFRHEPENIPKNLEKFLLEASFIETVKVRELQGLNTEEIREWVQRERHVGLLFPQLSRIRRNSGGFPILLAPWIQRSTTLDPEELKGKDLRLGVCLEVSRRISEPPPDLEIMRFLHQLSVLQSPPVEGGSRSYEDLMGLDSVTVASYSQLLEKKWILNGNIERPWFRHELIKACIEDGLREAERIELHRKAAEFYEKLLNKIGKAGKHPVPFGVALGCAYHFHEACEHKKSYEYNSTLARFATDVGELDVADECFRRAVEDAQALKDEGAVIAEKGDWAKVLATWGKLAEAKAIHSEAQAFFEKKGDLRGSAVVLHHLGVIEQDQGNYDEARKLCNQSLEIKKKLGDQAEIAKTLGELATIACFQRSYDEAKQLYNQVLETFTKLGDQAGIAITLHQLGNMEYLGHNYDEAKKLYNQSLEIEQKLGDQAGIAITLHQLGIIEGRKGNYDEAKKLYNQSLEIEQKLGDQAGISRTLHQLAMIEQDQGNYDEARKLCNQSLEIKKKLGDQAGIAATLHQLGNMEYLGHNYDEAKKLCNQSLEIEQKVGDQSKIAKTLHQLAMIEQDQGNYDEAKKLYNQSLEIEQKLGDQAGISRTLHQLAMIEQDQGNYDEAKKLYNQSLEIEQKLGDQSGIASTLHQLGTIEQDKGNYDEARNLYNQSLEIKQKLGDQSGIASTLHALGNTEYSQDNYDEAKKLYHQSLEISQRLGYQPVIARTLRQQGVIAQDQGRLKEAEEKVNKALKLFKRIGDKPMQKEATKELERIREKLKKNQKS